MMEFGCRHRGISTQTTPSDDFVATDSSATSEANNNCPSTLVVPGRELKKAYRIFSLRRSSKIAAGVACDRLPGGGAPVDIDWRLESSPVVFHGAPEDSKGAFVSGLLIMDVSEKVVEIQSCSAILNIQTKYSHPGQSQRASYRSVTTALRSWPFLVKPVILNRGRYQFPFSVLLCGALPSSLNSEVASIAYNFVATTYVRVGESKLYVPIKLERTLWVSRSLQQPLSLARIMAKFPPTNIKVTAHFNSVIYSISKNTVNLQLEGLVADHLKFQTVDIWRLKNVTWKLEEKIKVTVAAGEADTAISNPIHTETRFLGGATLYSGWKSDFEVGKGITDIAFDYAIDATKNQLDYACDLSSGDGIEVTHSLLIEMRLSKEFAPANKTQTFTPTGTGRLLNLRFSVVVAEAPSSAVSWENEVPPNYNELAQPPPEYPWPTSSCETGFFEG